MATAGTSCSLLDQPAFRSRFPTLDRQVYLATCSQGAPALDVLAALDAYRESWIARGAAWDEWLAAVDAARRAFARLVGARDDEVAVVSCASEGAYQVVASLPAPPAGRGRIVTSDLEFPSIAHVWMAQAARGFEVAFSPASRAGLAPELAAEDVTRLVDERTALVSVPLAAYANGFRADLRAIVADAHAKGARVFVDAYQGLGVLPCDVRELGCDYLVAGALKYLLGVPGIAFLYVRRELVELHRPTLTGWFGRREPFAFDPRTLDWSPTARRFETGTAAIPAAYAAAAGIGLLLRTDRGNVFAHVQQLADRLAEGLAAAGFELFSPEDRERRGPQVAVRVPDPGWVAATLADPAGPPARQAGRPVLASPRGSALRLSLHFYNDESDVEAAIRALSAALR